MTPAQVKEMYSRLLALYGQTTVKLRRHTGTGHSRTPTDYSDIAARVHEYQPDELIGGIVQGDRKFIIFADDVADSGFTVPFVATADKLVVDGRELAIKSVDDNTRRIGDTLIAYEIRAGG